MPSRPLPIKLVDSFRKGLKKQKKWHGNMDQIHEFLGHLPNIDPRRNMDTSEMVRRHGAAPWRSRRTIPETNTSEWSRRIRLLNVSKQYPDLGEVVLKRVHPNRTVWPKVITAKDHLLAVNRLVSEHNRQFGNRDYILLKPYAYALTNDVLVMARDNSPTLEDILKHDPKATKYFEAFSKKHGITRAQFEEKANLVENRLPESHNNLILIGFKNGKFVFLHLPDYF